MFLIDDILLSPISGLRFILQQIQKMADQELNDPQVVKEHLLELQLRHESGEISEVELAEAEAEIFARLRAAKEGEPVWTDTAGSSQVPAVSVELHLDDPEE